MDDIDHKPKSDDPTETSGADTAALGETDGNPLPLARQVASQLRDMIVQDTLAPGARIRERQLSEAMNVSRTPLREALKVLEIEGLVENIPNRGAIVAELRPDMVKGLVQVLAALESLAGRLAAECASDEEIAEIRALHFEMLAAYTRKDKLAYFKFNQAIHRAIVVASKNDVLTEFHDRVNARVYRVRYRTNMREEWWPEAIKGHNDIIEALESRDAEKLAAILQVHIENIWRKVSALDYKE